MESPLTLQELQDGLIDFDTAVARISAKVSRSTAPQSRPRASSAHAAVRRSAEGKVVLSSTSTAVELPSIPERRKIALLPVEAVHVLDGLTPPEPPESVSARSDEHAASEVEDGATEIVSVAHPATGVAVITLHDEVHRNMFTDELSRQVRAALDAIIARDDARAIVVQGYGNWFCSGGTPELLERIRRGAASFLDDPTFRMLLDCPLPTISAMSGHALGGGLTFGLYADIVVMAEQSFYAANFMEHGFTPGVGATFLFPHKLGSTLGAEMLLTASRYQGRDLKARGAPVAILPKEQVLQHAITLASRMASVTRGQITGLKARLAEPVKAALKDTLEAEQSLHEKVFAEFREGNGGR